MRFFLTWSQPPWLSGHSSDTAQRRASWISGVLGLPQCLHPIGLVRKAQTISPAFVPPKLFYSVLDFFSIPTKSEQFQQLLSSAYSVPGTGRHQEPRAGFPRSRRAWPQARCCCWHPQFHSRVFGGTIRTAGGLLLVSLPPPPHALPPKPTTGWQS